ncbi:META domain-containing protein [Lacinutrix himadriensis]|uniref:META domain-containing protein n=1 Tax=Lacinutrix himadriensis TaxID=641549 RepID=UPI0006E1BFD6|nr:META domain-containing protein [Lacinutrix himadriensis]
MKFITILLTVFALESCGNTKAATNLQNNIEAKQTETLSGKYMISSFIDNTELPDNIHLNFDATTNKVSGFAGCNNFSATYSTEGNTIKFGPLMSTKMMCKRFMDVEQNFLKTLEKVTAFSVENNVLTLKNSKENLVFAAKNNSSKIAQGDDYSIEYISSTRGSFLKIEIKNDSIISQKQRGAAPEARKFSPSETTDIFNKVAVLNLEELENLESPSKAHQYDGAAAATLIITKNGKTYSTKAFDAGKPNAKIEDLVNTIFSLSEKQ